MRIHFGITADVPLNVRRNPNLKIHSVSDYDTIPEPSDVSSYNGANFLAEDVGLIGTLRISHDFSAYEAESSYEYEFWVDTDLFNKDTIFTTNKFVAWNHLTKYYLDVFLEIVIPQVRDMRIEKILT